MNIYELMQKLFDHIHKNCTHNYAKKVDGLYIQKSENVRYISGFSGSFGRILLSKKKMFLISDARYSESAKHFAYNNGLEYREILSSEGGKNFWKNLEKEAEISHLAFESHNCTYQQFENLKKNFSSKIVPVSFVVEYLRQQKTEEEIICIQKASEIGDKALKKVVENFKEGISEKELCFIFEFEAKKHFGAENISFDTIVAFGENSAIAHHCSSGKKLKENTPILIDCGVKFSGYCSDMTRCFWFGKPKTKQEKENFLEWKSVYKKVYDAQKQGIQKIKVGEKISAPDEQARIFLGDYEKYFTHTFGHGVGLEIHEFPTITKNRGDTTKFLENMVVTAEPGLYFSGKFGVRIEDLLLIEKKKTRMLSKFPYEI